MSATERAKAALEMAIKDLNAVKGMENKEIFAEEIFGFHAQQAIEKSLKAWIASLGIDYPLTHNIITLLTILEENKSDVEGLWDLVKFNSFAIQFRYESFENLGVELNRQEVIERISSLVEHVQNLIG